jgi:hypothetical protein
MTSTSESKDAITVSEAKDTSPAITHTEDTHQTMVELKKQIELLALNYHTSGGIQASYVECSHVTQVWQDGEITSTKCGSLYGQRRLILMKEGVNAESCILTTEWQPCMPNAYGANSFAFVASDIEANELHELIKKLAKMLKGCT